MSASQRTKGASGERELCGLIRDELGVRLVRNLDQTRNGGHDLIPDPTQNTAASLAISRYAIEVKRHAKASPAIIREWWDQADAQAKTAGLVPCLAYRADRSVWRFILPLSAIDAGLTLARGIEYTAELSLPGFCAIVREADF